MAWAVYVSSWGPNWGLLVPSGSKLDKMCRHYLGVGQLCSVRSPAKVINASYVMGKPGCGWGKAVGAYENTWESLGAHDNTKGPYYQDYNIFRGHRATLTSLFEVDHRKLSKSMQELGPSDVVVHIRKDDDVSRNVANAFPTVDYFLSALHLVNQSVPIRHTWLVIEPGLEEYAPVLELIKVFGARIHKGTNMEDHTLARLAYNLVTSTGTFSWTAAYLSLRARTIHMPYCSTAGDNWIPWASLFIEDDPRIVYHDICTSSTPGGAGAVLGTGSFFSKEATRAAQAAKGCLPLPRPFPGTAGALPEMIAAWQKRRMEELWPAQGLQGSNLNGGINPFQAAAYEQLFSTTKEKRVFCETGFFRGASTLLWLMLHPQATVHTFDINENRQALEWFDTHFAGRVKMYVGDSRKTIPEFVKQGVKCDWISVDGDHSGTGPYEDMKNLAMAARASAVVVSDDTFQCDPVVDTCRECLSCKCAADAKGFCNDCSSSYWRGHKEGFFQHNGCQTFGFSVDKAYPIGFCHGSM
jgi:hypothetical protein